MTGDDDGEWVGAQCLSDRLRGTRRAEPARELAVGDGVARRDRAGSREDAAVEFRDVVEVEHEVAQIVAHARQQRDDARDGRRYRRRRRLFTGLRYMPRAICRRRASSLAAGSAQRVMPRSPQAMAQRPIAVSNSA